LVRPIFPILSGKQSNLSLKMGFIGGPEMLVANYHSGMSTDYGVNICDDK